VEEQGIVYAVNSAIRDASGRQGARCFLPRHVLRITSGGETVDVLLCFECWRYQIIREGDEQPYRRGIVSSEAQPLLDRVLAEAGVPLAPK
jgi:hypothetical protein